MGRIKNFFLIFVLGIYLCSCARSVHKDTFVVSGTYLEVISPYRQASKIVYEEFRRLDKIFNFYDSNSEISWLNSTFNQPFVVSDELLEVLEISKEINQATDGSFDVTAGALYDFWKTIIKKEPAELPSQDKVKQLQETGGFSNVDIDFDKGQVTIKKEGLKIDLSGIAKGYMVDKAAEKLRENGITSAIINAGGDIYCLGKNMDKAWQIGIRDPLTREVIEKQELVNKAIATSGGYEQFFKVGSRKFSHLVDTRAGFPVDNNILSVSVVSRDCMMADSLATAFSVMGLAEIESFFNNKPSSIEAFVVVRDGIRKYIKVFGKG
ncbi:MAG: FAD:protein FMN transferase [Candidatus Omnitrophota bacterium]|nr:MAG: FAD:protein FMN transferase [Candidatus Omnitrophota bacterium]